VFSPRFFHISEGVSEDDFLIFVQASPESPLPFYGTQTEKPPHPLSVGAYYRFILALYWTGTTLYRWVYLCANQLYRVLILALDSSRGPRASVLNDIT